MLAVTRTRSALKSGPADRLSFLEALLASDSLVEASRLYVDWLARGTRVRQIAIALVDLERGGGPRLVGAAGRGIAVACIRALSIDLEEREHPLVQALFGASGAPVAPAVLRSARLSFSGPCHAYALPCSAADRVDPVGVALIGGEARDPNVCWGLEMLGRKLLELRNLRVLAATERRLAHERAVLQSVLRAIPDPILLTDLEGRSLVANPRAEFYFTSQDDESDGRRGAVELNNMLFAASLARHTIDKSGFTRRELPLVDPGDGSDRLFELNAALIATPGGKAIVSVLRNVTELQMAAQEIEDNYRRLRVAETEVRAERDRLDLVIDSVADPIVVTDASGAVTMTNQPGERLFTVGPHAPVEDIHRVRANALQLSAHVANLVVLEPGGRFRGELVLIEPRTGASVSVEAISGKVGSEHGEVNAIVTILHDLTKQMERNALYEELKQASSLLEEKVGDATAELVRQNELLQRQALDLEAASSAKSLFLANMSHEFRTPLNAILGYTSMILQGVSGSLSPPLVRQLTRIDSNGRHLLTIINDILDIARIEAGRMPLNMARFAASDVVQEILAELEPLIARAKPVVVSKISAGLPMLRSDRSKVKQIIMNLISNALKFTPSGSITVSARFNKRRAETWIAVVDTGIGIAAKDREVVFQDFRQVDNSPTRLYGGTGLGLAICRRLAGVLGGEVRLSSEVARGSTFTLVLPTKGGASPKGGR